MDEYLLHMDRTKLIGIYDHFLSEMNKASEKDGAYDMVDMVVCRRISELLWLIIMTK